MPIDAAQFAAGVVDDGLLLESVEASAPGTRSRPSGNFVEKDETADFRSFLAVDREHVSSASGSIPPRWLKPHARRAAMAVRGGSGTAAAG